jgi:hypothetical protein
MPLKGAEALRRVRGAGRLRVVPGGEALSQFDYRNKNCGTNIVVDCAAVTVPNRSSELIAGTFGIPA